MRHETGVTPRRRSLCWILQLGGWSLFGAGIAGGLAAAFLLTRSLESLLFGVTPTDPAVLAAISAGLFLVAAAACGIPARRAARVEPIVALRGE